MGTKIYDPNMTITVVDQSVPSSENEADALDYSLAVVIPGFSSKGIDNVITENKTSASLLANFGDDFASYSKYGQANLMALAVAKSKGRVFFCRLLPDDAGRAYTVFGVYVKKTTVQMYERSDTVYSADRTSVVSFGTGAFTLTSAGAKVECLIKSAAADAAATVKVTLEGVELTLGQRSVTADQFDDDGKPTLYNGDPVVITDASTQTSSTFYPLFTLYYYGRGKGGNMFGFTIDRDSGRDKARDDGRRYYITFFEELSSGTMSELYSDPEYFSFNPDALFSAESTVIDGLSTVYQNQDETTNQDKPIQMINYDSNYTKLVNALAEYKDASETIYDIDFINGLFRNGNPYGRIVFSNDSLNVASTVTTLDGGTDGSIDIGATVGGVTVTAATAEAKKTELLVSFFNCDIDESILDEKIIDADVAPDCNFPAAVKKSMLANFSTYRPDIALRMDCGITSNFKDAYNAFTEYSPYVNSACDYMVSFNACCGVLSDSNVGSPYSVTYTYDYMKSLADNFAAGSGAFQMHAGTGRGKVKYMRPTWFARKSKTNMMETLEDAKLNYIEAIDRNGNYMYGCETSQNSVANSKLCSDRNALIIGRGRRTCQKVLINYKYDERSIDDSIKAATTACNAALRASNIPTTVGITVNIYQTKQDKKTENAHCDITFKFPGYIKKWTVTIIAKRETSEDDE